MFQKRPRRWQMGVDRGTPVGVALQEAQVQPGAVLADDVLGARLPRRRVGPVLHQLLQPAPGPDAGRVGMLAFRAPSIPNAAQAVSVERQSLRTPASPAASICQEPETTPDCWLRLAVTSGAKAEILPSWQINKFLLCRGDEGTGTLSAMAPSRAAPTSRGCAQ